MKTLVIDNYDSFTYNLVQILRKLTQKEPVVRRNDEITLREVEKFDMILLSPGPGIPEEAGKLMEILETFAPQKNILGICLGHQAIAQCFGATLTNLHRVYHGVATPVHLLKKDPLFKDLPENITAGRYHSWIVNKETLPQTLEILAEDEQGHIMALKHKLYPVWGIQFHPESILTDCGETIIRNWLETVLIHTEK